MVGSPRGVAIVVPHQSVGSFPTAISPWPQPISSPISMILSSESKTRQRKIDRGSLDALGRTSRHIVTAATKQEENVSESRAGSVPNHLLPVEVPRWPTMMTGIDEAVASGLVRVAEKLVSGSADRGARLYLAYRWSSISRGVALEDLWHNWYRCSNTLKCGILGVGRCA